MMRSAASFGFRKGTSAKRRLSSGGEERAVSGTEGFLKGFFQGL